MTDATLSTRPSRAPGPVTLRRHRTGPQEKGDPSAAGACRLDDARKKAGRPVLTPCEIPTLAERTQQALLRRMGEPTDLSPAPFLETVIRDSNCSRHEWSSERDEPTGRVSHSGSQPRTRLLRMSFVERRSRPEWRTGKECARTRYTNVRFSGGYCEGRVCRVTGSLQELHPNPVASSVPDVPSGREADSPRCSAEAHPSHATLGIFRLQGKTESETHRPLTTR